MEALRLAMAVPQHLRRDRGIVMQHHQQFGQMKAVISAKLRGKPKALGGVRVAALRRPLALAACPIGVAEQRVARASGLDALDQLGEPALAVAHPDLGRRQGCIETRLEREGPTEALLRLIQTAAFLEGLAQIAPSAAVTGP